MVRIKRRAHQQKALLAICWQGFCVFTDHRCPMHRAGDVASRQIRIGMTTYLNCVLSGMVMSAELLPSCRAICTIS